ncbi:MAG: N-acetylmuramoyl-L-alanine amidase [Phascolarctobacterium sp.]|nr:N-acetylmuramoyl-L-alanine amidase [Phascolarctobacterium sp.]
MRKFFVLLATLICIVVNATASAAQVTDVKWGVDKYNILRFVVDMTDLVAYNVNLEGNQLTLTISAPLKSGVNPGTKIKSSLTTQMAVTSSATQTTIKVPLNKTITANDYKAFTLRKDPQTKRPARIVLDVTADKTDTPIVPAAAATVAKPGTAAKHAPKPAKKPAGEPALASGKSTPKYRTGGGIKDKIITIDPGHGGTDPGAIGSSGTREKDITLQISKKIEEHLKKCGAKVFLTRTTDVDVCGPRASDKDELQSRVNVAEKHGSDVFISVHINAAVNRKLGGITSYYFPKSANDQRLSKALQKKLASNFGVDNLGVREANFYVVKRCSMPATLLELCFISNPKEEKLIKGAWFQNKAAQLIADAIEEYFK